MQAQGREGQVRRLLHIVAHPFLAKRILHPRDLHRDASDDLAQHFSQPVPLSRPNPPAKHKSQSRSFPVSECGQPSSFPPSGACPGFSALQALFQLILLRPVYTQVPTKLPTLLPTTLPSTPPTLLPSSSPSQRPSTLPTLVCPVPASSLAYPKRMSPGSESGAMRTGGVASGSLVRRTRGILPPPGADPGPDSSAD